jgi:hypothetical protein
MENVINIRMALEQLGTGWRFGGSVTDGGASAWQAVTWEDERAKPTWADLCAAHDEGLHTGMFVALRAARDARLMATDKYLLPDYPINEADLAAIRACRAALRDLPEQPGAPWDGGGESTPWPVAACAAQVEQPCA